MRVRAGLTAIAVVSAVLLGCGGDDGGGGGSDRTAGADDTKAEERTSAELHLETVATIDAEIKAPVLTDAGIVAVRGDRLVLISAEDGSVLRGSEGYSSATADDPSIGHVVQLDDGRVFAKTGVQGMCGWALVEPASLALGAPIATSDTVCGFSGQKVVGRSVIWVRDDIQATPTVRYLESADLDAGTTRSVRLEDALPAGYSLAPFFGSSLVRVPDGSVAILVQKDGDPSWEGVATIAPDLSISDPQPLELEAEPWLMYQMFGLPRILTKSAVWYLGPDPSAGGSEPATMRIVLANRAGDELATLAAPKLTRSPDDVFGVSGLSMAADDDTAFLFRTRQAEDGPDADVDTHVSYTTTIYRVDAD